MSVGLHRALWALGLAGFIGGLAILVVVLDSPYADDASQLYALAPMIVWAFVGTGIYAWARRPENRTGPLLVATGFAWIASTLIVARPSSLFMVGWAVYLLPYALLFQMLVTYPEGRARTWTERGLVALGWFICVGIQLALVPIFEPGDKCDCFGVAGHGNPFLVNGRPDLAHTLTMVQSYLAIAALLWVALLLRRRWQEASPGRREVLTPVYLAGAVLVATLMISVIADVTGSGDAPEAIADVTSRLAFAGVPFAFLLGLARGRFSRALAVSDLVERLGERRRPLRDALADALGDPGLRLAFRVGGGHVDAEGRRVSPPAGGWTPVERDGRPVGAIVHDPALSAEQPEALRAVAGAAALALDNERLEVELRARIDELRESRSRIVRAADAERRRLERDLHDGAQQRLVSLALTLRLARSRAGGEVAELLDEAAAELQQATDELRELARGIHPAVLTDRGLAPALSALAGRSPVPVELGELPRERLPAGVESATYFVVAEALTNVARYARATHAAVDVRRVNGSVTVEVRDDGVGGADPAAGSGLRGLADRVSALDGRLDVDSPPGAGTTVRAVLPCES